MKFLSALLAVLLLSICPAVSAADTTEPTPIYTTQELLAVQDDPQGSYILMNDLDLAGIPWRPLDFSGTFDGNGHALLNLELSQSGAETATTYDGNVKPYDTYFAGFFGVLRDAEVKNLRLLNVRGLVETDTPFFLGGLAGFSEDSTITDCTVTGCLELRAFDRMFGIAGLVGYGNGTVHNCKVDVTLICTDTDATTMDEQFMGGIFSTGYMDVTGCEIIIAGYSSEFGYSHNGGITGMYMRNPIGVDYAGNLYDNTITGKITFFERNTSRRAYCGAEIGELLGSYSRITNITRFSRDERFAYDKELRPDMCPDPIYTETVVPSDCSTYGYTEYTCSTCGYTYRDNYTLLAHEVTQWSVVEESTLSQMGLSQGNCSLCGLTLSRREPMLESLPTEAPTEAVSAPTTAEVTEPDEPEESPFPVIPVLLGGGLALVLLIIILISRKPRGGKAKGGKFLKR